MSLFERGKPEFPEKYVREQGRDVTTNSTQIWCIEFKSWLHWWEASAVTIAPPFLELPRDR